MQRQKEKDVGHQGSDEQAKSPEKYRQNNKPFNDTCMCQNIKDIRRYTLVDVRVTSTIPVEVEMLVN